MIAKYYSLDECSDTVTVYEKLSRLQDDGKIYWSNPEQDVIRIRDSGLTPKDVKELISFFEKNDVLEYHDYEDMYEDDEDDEDYFDEDEDEYEEEF